MEKEIITEFGRIFRQYKLLAEKAIDQLPDEQLFAVPGEETNSIAIIMQHMIGNLKSRFTDFYTTDGEKPDRHRDNEFILQVKDKVVLMNEWNNAWQILFPILENMQPTDLQKEVTIRGEKHSVYNAMQRQVAHYSYHVGQIVYIARLLKGNSFVSLSIPKGQSDAFNESMRKKLT